jgi:hypothetical protein
MKQNLKNLGIGLSPLLLGSCAVVGYSSGSGWFFWPGGWIGLAVIVIVFLILAFWPR